MEKRNQEIRHHETIGSGHEITIGFIGLGNMGCATVKALIASEIVSPDHLLVSNKDRSITMSKLAAAGIDTYAVTVVEDNDTLVRRSDMVIMATKQKQLKEELLHWREKEVLRDETLLVSIVAGVSTGSMKRWLGREKLSVARAMPNTPVQSGRGYIGWYVSPETLVAQENSLRRIMDALGKNVQVLEEDKIHDITAFSGSGVAYAVFDLERILREIAIENGLPSDIAREMVRETIIGAATHMDATGDDGVVLRDKVTSPNGTTYAALKKSEELGLKDTLRQMVAAAHERSVEIEEEYRSA